MKKLLLFITLNLLVFASVDINNASVKDLATLKGVGAKKAEVIVAYRKDHCFKNADELTKIKGIGKKIVQKNRDEIVVGECKN